jgi:hypothetical protein
MKRSPRPAAGPAAPPRQLDEAARAFAAGRLDEAARLYQRAWRAAPDDIRAPYSLAVIDLRRGRPKRALERLRQVVERAPDHPFAWHNLGAAAQATRGWDEAADAYARALSLRPDAVETRRNLAIVLAVLGRIDEAVAQHRALAAAPESRPWALTRIALLRPEAITDGELGNLQSAVEEPDTDEETRIGVWFALGETLEVRGRDDEAFAAFAAGNRAKHAALERTSPPAAVAHANEAAARFVEALFTPALVAELAGKGAAGASPIFVVGMPRSGSTLVEQILGSHPAVQELGETGAMTDLLGRYPRRLTRAVLRGLRERYIAAMRERGWDGRRRLVDKTLENYVHVGLIALIFPDAVILESQRNPMDTCLSCYRQLFESGNETLYDLAEIGAEYSRYRRLMDHWRAVLPGRVAVIDYDALVADPEGRTPAIVAAAGLEWEPATLRFFERAGAVETASAAQVRRPIYRTSVERWRRHASRLGPLIKALGPLADQPGA